MKRGKNRTRSSRKKGNTRKPVASHTRRMTFNAKTTSVLVTAGICVGLLVGPHLPPEATSWVTVVLKALVAGLIKRLSSPN